MDLDKLKHDVNVESVQKTIDRNVREKLEKFHNYKIVCCGLIFEHSVEDLSYEMIMGSLVEKLNDQSVVAQRIEINNARLFNFCSAPGQTIEESYIPVTFVNVWYYVAFLE
jgi:hypothetical protein